MLRIQLGVLVQKYLPMLAITEHENWTREWTEQPNLVQNGTRPKLRHAQLQHAQLQQLVDPSFSCRMIYEVFPSILSQNVRTEYDSSLATVFFFFS